MDPVLYFAYGSNLDPAVRRERGLPVTPATAGWLRDHRLAFTRPSRRWGATANLEPCPGRSVWGILVEIDRGQSPRVVEAEGGHVRIDLDVDTAGGPVRARCHVARRHPRNGAVPSLGHVWSVYEGLRLHGAPADYVAQVLRAGLREYPARPGDGAAAELARASIEAMVDGLGADVPGLDCTARELESLCHAVARAQHSAAGGGPAGAWSCGRAPRHDGAVPDDHTIEATAASLALLAAYRVLPVRELPDIPGCDDRIRRGMEYLAAARLAGPHLDRLARGLRVVRMLARGRIPSMLASDPGACPALASELRALQRELADILERSPVFGAWGVPPRQEVAEALGQLAPLAGG